MYYKNQRACIVQPLSAELILWITVKSWGPCTFGLPLTESQNEKIVYSLGCSSWVGILRPVIFVRLYLKKNF